MDYNKSRYEKLATSPLTFEILSNGNITWIIGAGSTERTIQYSKNGGEWTPITSTTAGTAISVVAGDELRFKGTSYPASLHTNYSKFISTCSFEAKGNPVSLCYGEKPTGEEPVSNYCYYGLFRGCTGITTAKDLALPATTLAGAYCYNTMFQDCINLTEGPELPATSLSTNCYQAMFYGCSGLLTAPELPCSAVPANAYRDMFKGCTSLVSAPALPSTTLTQSCYGGMFYGCTALTSAPELPAATLVTYCYSEMFRGCSSLASVTCLATDLTTSNGLNAWLNGVAASGTFTKKSGITWPSGASGIPNGWTVQNAP